MIPFMFENIEILKEIKTFVSKFTRQIVLVVTSRVVQIPFILITPVLYKILIDKVMIKKQLDMLKWVCLGYIVMFILQSLAISYQRLVGTRVCNKIGFVIKSRLWSTLSRMPYERMKDYQTGDLKNRLDQDADALYRFIDQQIVENIYAWTSLVLFSAVLVILCWKLALFSFIIIPVSFLIAKLIGNGRRKASDALRKIWGEYENWLFNNFQAWKEVKNLTAERRIQKVFVHYWKMLCRIFLKQAMFVYYSMSFDSFKDVFINRFNMYFIGGILIYNNELTIGGLLIFMKYFEQVYTSVSTISNINIQLNTDKPSIRKVLEIVRQDTRYRGMELNRESFRGDIQFKDVSFRWGNEQPWILRDINFKICKNSKIAVVGKSGSGKTTLVKLLLGLYKRGEGQILIDGHNIEDINPRSLHEVIGVVMQDSQFFNMSIRENLLLAKPAASDEDLAEVCKMAAIHGFIDTLPDKYDTVIGENGVKLSGGQRQRLAIARTLLTNPRVVIFDEATSSLDHISEKKIHEAILAISKDRTVIIIAHRLTSVLLADRVMVIDEGRITGFDHHSRLLGRNRMYDLLFKEQYRGVGEIS